METNQLNSGELNTLQVGECLLTKAYKTRTDKIQLEFAEKVTAKDRPMSALSVLNGSDARFSSGAARGWAVATIEDASNIFGVNFGDDGEWYLGEKSNGKECEMMDLNILNPIFNNTFFRVRIVETTEPTASQQKYADEMGVDVIETQAKRAGKGGDHILHKGQHIFRNSYVDLLPEGYTPEHTFLASDTQTTNTVANVGVKAEEVEIDSMY
mgnify:CR=1 FL=1|tara:strand:- start:236 stop:871 length:636 start_codon:yes stop_codon:yes gene_type:complete